MSEKLKQLIANNTLSVRQAKTIEELAEIEETFFKGIESLFSLQGVRQLRELLLGFKENEYFDLYEQGEVSFKNAIEMYLTQ